MGTTAEDVADTMRKNSVQGVRNAVRFLNPIIRYLHVCLKTEAIDMDVTRGDRLRLLFPRGRVLEVAIPTPAIQFIQAFDSGSYPELDLGPKASHPDFILPKQPS